MKDRFDLENDIMNVWAIKDQMRTLLWRMFDHPEMLSEDDQMNQLSAIEYTIDLNCAKMMDTFCQVFELNEYASDEVKELREATLRKYEKEAEERTVPFPVPKNYKKKAKK